MNQREKTKGVALRCNLQGRIMEIIQDTFGGGNMFPVGEKFTSAIHQGSLLKALNFLTELQKSGAVFDWELYAQSGEQPLCLYLSGVIVNEELFLVGVQNRSELFQLFNKTIPGGKEILEKTGRFVAAAGKGELSDDPNIQGDEIFDQLTALYNEMANLERRLSKKTAELEKLSAQKDRFLGMAAHELRHPLVIVNMLSDFLLEEAAPLLIPEHAQYITTIKTYSESMQSLVDDFLDMAIIQSGKLLLNKKPTNLLEIFEKNLLLNRLIAQKKRIELDFFHDKKIPQVMVDPAKMEQVLNNLIVNALKFSPEGSRVEIRLTYSGNEVIFKVKDQGPGIPPEILPKLFEPFERTPYPQDENIESAGLGLAIAQKIVEAHEGRIHAESETGKGATLTVALPLEPHSDS